MQTSPRKNFVLLHVEDNSADADLVSEFFASELPEISCLRAKDPAEVFLCLNKVGNFSNAPKPDLILLDLNLGHESGFDVLKKIKADPLHRQTPVIIFTTSDCANDIAEGHQSGANSYIVKPYDLDEVEKVLREIAKFWFGMARLR